MKKEEKEEWSEHIPQLTTELCSNLSYYGSAEEEQTQLYDKHYRRLPSRVCQGHFVVLID